MKITELFAFITERTPLEERVMEIQIGDTRIVMMGTDFSRIPGLRQTADLVSKSTKKPYRVMRYVLEGEIPPPVMMKPAEEPEP